VYAYGFRNPYRMNFDNVTGKLWVGDVGQFNIEEVDDVVAAGNYGWWTKEGSFLYNPADGTVTPDVNGTPGLIDPVGEYDHDEGSTIIGGTVYRGSLIPELQGKYVFADFYNYNPSVNHGRLLYMDPVTGHFNELTLDTATGQLPSSLAVYGFGLDAAGEMYFTGSDGRAMQLIPGYVTWINPFGGAWSTSEDWSSQLVPAAAVNARLTLPGTYTLSLTAPSACKSLVASAGRASVNLSGHSLSVASNVNIAPNGTDDASFTIVGAGVMTVGGSLAVGGSIASAGGVGSVTVSSGSTLSVNGNLKIWGGGVVTYSGTGMSIGGTLDVVGGTLSVSTGGNRLLRVGNTAISAGGIVDLNDNDMIATSASYADVVAQISAARNDGAWDQSGITSTAARNQPNGITTLGTLTGEDYLEVSRGAPLFDGQSVAAADVLVKYTYYGDSNFDGDVTLDDYAFIDGGFLLNLTGWLYGDYDYSGGKPDPGRLRAHRRRIPAQERRAGRCTELAGTGRLGNACRGPGTAKNGRTLRTLWSGIRPDTRGACP
ncbi:MAG: PQQ-dependent sugar dehydrogenase, partial [Tepidisphaeraceae bacterium]